MSDYPRGHDMSEMAWPTSGYCPTCGTGHSGECPSALRPSHTESIAAAHIAKLDERIAEQDTTIRRLSDENAALKALLCDLGMGIPKIYPDDPLPEHQYRDGNGDVHDVLRGKELNDVLSAGIYGTDFPECPDVNMPGSGPENGEKLNDAKDLDPTSELVTRWRNGKRYELTPEDARRFDEGEE